MLRKLALLIGCMMFSVTALAVTSGSKPSSGNGASSGKKAASGGGGSAGGASGIKAANNQFGFQSISTNVNYIEIGSGRLGTMQGTLDTETGQVPGRAYYFSAMNDALLGNDYFKVTFDRSSGRTNYIGAVQGGIYGTVGSTSSAVFMNYSARYGRGFDIRGSSMLTPYIEFGSHTWERGINYGETYTNKYAAIGVLNQYSLGNGMVLDIDAMYGHTNRSYIVVVSGPGLIGFSGALGDSELYKLGVTLDYALAQRFHGTLGLEYTAFTYGISAIYPSGASVIWEPDSRTNYMTVRLGLGWGF